MTHTCYDCANLVRETECWEMPHIQWWECAVRPSVANLRSFPFHHTKCVAFKPAKRTPMVRDDDEKEASE